MHVVSSGRNYGGGGGGRSGGASSSSAGRNKEDPDGRKKGDAGKTTYRIGNQKFTLDGKDGKTLDDVIEELVATSGSDRNWKGMFIATLVILAVFGLVTIAVYIKKEPDDILILGEKMSFGDFLTGSLSGEGFNGTWISDTEILYKDTSSCISILNVPSMDVRVLVPNTTYFNLNVVAYGVSADRQFVYLGTDYYKNYRHSFWAKYTIYEISTGSLYRVIDTPESALTEQEFNEVSADKHPYLQYLTFTPKGNGYVFVFKNNIYYKPSVKSDAVYPLTTDGVANVVFNGIPDWVYEEELLSQNNAIWVSPDSTQLAYVQFNDSGVSEVTLPVYDDSSPYVRYGSFRYPKAGSPNPVISLKIVDLSNLQDLKSFNVRPPAALRNGDHYIVGAKWANDSILSVIWMNREQTISMVTHCNKESLWRCTEAYRETIRPGSKGWSELYSTPVYDPAGGEEMLVIAPILDGYSGLYRHVMKVQFGSSAIQRPVTFGRREVTKIHGWDKEKNFIYFTAHPEGQPTYQHLYRVATVEGDGKKTDPNFRISNPPAECISCLLAEMVNTTETEVSLLMRKHDFDTMKSKDKLPKVLTPTGCLFNQAHFSRDLTYFALHCAGPDIPKVLLFESASLKQILTLENNTKVRDKVANMSLPYVRNFRVNTSSGYDAYVKLYLPPELRVKDYVSYPLVISVYAGPGSQAVQEKWKMGWPAYLASQQGWIVAQIDGRGSSGAGDKRKFEIYEKLGEPEVQDQLEIARYLADKLRIIDPRRIGMWGWSFGGFATLRALSEENQDTVQCGIAVAPVTDWRLYDSVYTERYMGKPGIESNFKAYERASVINRAANFRPTEKTLRRLFLIHGSRDDNVHVQHTMLLSKALTDAGVDFKQQIYADAAHDLMSVRPQFYLSMEQFFSECFHNLERNSFVMEDEALNRSNYKNQNRNYELNGDASAWYDLNSTSAKGDLNNPEALKAAPQGLQFQAHELND